MDVPLEGSGRVYKPERHHHVLEVAVSRTERCFPLVPLPDPDTVVGVLNIDFREPLRPRDSVYNLYN